MQKGQFWTHINWIKDKNKQTKLWLGENPFRYLGAKVSGDGKLISFFEKKESGLVGKWVPFRDLPEVNNKHLDSKHFGKEFSFADFYDTFSYSWDDGKTNFSDWAEKAAKKAGRKKVSSNSNI